MKAPHWDNHIKCRQCPRVLNLTLHTESAVPQLIIEMQDGLVAMRAAMHAERRTHSSSYFVFVGSVSGFFLVISSRQMR